MKRMTVVLVLAGFLLLPAVPTDAQEMPKKLSEMLLILDERVVSVDFEDRPLEKALAFLSNYTGVNLVLSPALQDLKNDLDLSVTLRLSKVSVRTALNVMLQLKGLASVYRHGIIMITTPKDARGKPYMRMYPIGDLTVRIRDFPAPEMMLRPSGSEDWGNIGAREEEGREHAFADPDFILDLITENTGGDTWEDEGVRISVTSRFLIVRTYTGVHRQVVRLLALLRAHR